MVFKKRVDKHERVHYDEPINVEVLNSEAPMSQKTVKLMQECAPLFNLLQDQRRLEILNVLFDHPHLSVSELSDQLELSRPAVSHHLKLMLDKALVSVVQEGKERYYSVNLAPALTKLKALVSSIETDVS